VTQYQKVVILTFFDRKVTEKGLYSVNRRLPVSNLPFLRKNQAGIAGVTTEYRSPDKDEAPEESDGEAPLKACAKDLIACVSSGDEAGVAKAIRAAFEILDSEPHEEGPHTNESEES